MDLRESWNIDSKQESSETSPSEADEASKRLCLDVIAEAWSLQHRSLPSTLKKSFELGLRVRGASPEQLNNAFMDHMFKVYTKEVGPEKAQRVMENMRKINKCR